MPELNIRDSLPPSLETPLLLLDRDRLDANLARMRARLSAFPVTLRPHVKTNKCLQVTERFFDGGRGPITVSTLREAEYFLAAGYRDILYAVAIVPNKFAHAAALLREGAALTLILDSLDAAQALAAYAATQEQQFSVLLEIDCDGHRSGLAPDAPLLPQIAALLRAGGVTLQGVMTHAGSSYDCRTTDEITLCARRERDAVRQAAARLADAGFPITTVSVGSTPTALFAADFDGITEVRAGVYAFFDLVMHGLGVCRLEDIAVSVLTTVIGHQAEKGWTIVDAGWMALSRDRGTASQALDQGYGVVCDVHGRPIPGLIVSAANQEHGIVTRRPGSAAGAAPPLPIGTQLRILPNHACATAAQHGGYHVIGGAGPMQFWPRIGGW
jgi:D-serine deaminase-like pyridoxal phosphate-dependent protein